MARPATQRLDVGDGVGIAYQAFGAGPTDLVFVPGFASHVELQWADLAFARFLHRLGSFVRVISYDKRGVGASDRVRGVVPVEQHARDLAALVAAEGRGRVIVLGFSDGAPAAGLFAANHPDRCLALVFCSSFVRTRGEPELVARVLQRTSPMIERWGEGTGLEVFAPSLAGSRINRSNYALFERASMTRDEVRALAAASLDLDVSDAVRRIDLPTLVLHREGDFIPIEAGRYVASLIPHARFVELEGYDHVPFAGETSALLAEIEGFVRAVTETPRPAATQAAVLFTDIVSSTERVAAVGDARWRDLVEMHDDLTTSTVEAHGGTAVKSTGDGWLATFPDAPSAVRAAWSIAQQVQRLGLQVRGGVHCGPVEIPDGRAEVLGATVHAAARVAGAAGADEVLVSDLARDLCAGSNIDFVDAGTFALKGLPGEPWTLHRLGGDPGDGAPANEVSPTPGLDAADRAVYALATRAPAVARAFGTLARPTGVSRS